MRCRAFLIAGLAEPNAGHGAGQVQCRAALLQPCIVDDEPYGAYGRNVLLFERPASQREARLYADALAGLFALMLRRAEWFEPIPLPGYVRRTRIDAEFVRRQIGRWIPDELYKSTKVMLFEDERIEDPPMTSALQAFAKAGNHLSALASYAASWHARIDTGYGIPDRDLIATWHTYSDSDSLAAVILHAFRSIEATLGGPLPGRDKRIAARLTARYPGIPARTWAGLIRELRYVERSIRGPALHGSSRGARIQLRDAVRAQRLAARLLGVTLNVTLASRARVASPHETSRFGRITA